MSPPAGSQFVSSVPELPADFIPNSYSDAVAMEPTATDPNIFHADLKRDWCIGLVPQGGYLMSVLATATYHYFTTTEASRNQPDLINLYVEFLSRTIIGPASITITPLKLGRQFSTVRAELFQPTGKGNEEVLCLTALITQGNLAAECRSGGLTLPTHPAIPTAEIPPRESCIEHKDDPDLFRRRTAPAKVIFKLPVDATSLGASPRLGPSIREQWVQWRSDTSGAGAGTRSGFSITALCFLADTFRPLVEAYGETGNWFPTMNCSVEVKKAPPTAGGWEWLFMRIHMRECRHGRMDFDVVILDERGDIVALSKHVALIVSAERNTKSKGPRL